MITIRINQASESDSGIKPQWITEQIQNRRKEDVSICVVFEVKCSGINVYLPIGQCPQGNGGGRKPNKKERLLLDKLDRIRDKEINLGLIISFWQDIKKFCR